MIAEGPFFGDLGVHNRIFLTLKDSHAGYNAELTLFVRQGNQHKEINYGGKKVSVSMQHRGEYTYIGATATVFSTHTNITITG